MAFSSPNDADPKVNVKESQLRDSKSVAASMHHLTASDSHHPGSVEFSALLENSVPLEAPRLSARRFFNPPSPDITARQLIVQSGDAAPQIEQVGDKNKPIDLERSNCNTTVLSATVTPQSEASEPAVDAAIIPLLEERLVIDRHRRKVGEVVVRKEIETHIVEVPIRREKLIVEQVSPEYKQLAVVDLGQMEADKSYTSDASLSQTASAKFTSANAAIEFIQAIAADSSAGLTTVQVNIVLVDEKLQTAYQQWLEQHSNTTDAYEGAGLR